MKTTAEVLALVGCIFFVFAIKRLGKVRTSRQGNMLAAVGMLLAIVAILLAETNISWVWIAAGILIGGAIGTWAARTVEMTSMPEMVALFNGSGGIASALVAIAYFLLYQQGIDAGEVMGGGSDKFTHDGTVTLML